MNILNFLTDEDIKIFMQETNEFKDSSYLKILIWDRDINFINCEIRDERDRDIFIKFMPFDLKLVNTNIPINLYWEKNTKIFWQAYLYLLFQDDYLNLLKNKLSNIINSWEETIQIHNYLIDKEIDFHNISSLKWPYIEGKTLKRIV